MALNFRRFVRLCGILSNRSETVLAALNTGVVGCLGRCAPAVSPLRLPPSMELSPLRGSVQGADLPGAALAALNTGVVDRPGAALAALPFRLPPGDVLLATAGGLDHLVNRPVFAGDQKTAAKHHCALVNHLALVENNQFGIAAVGKYNWGCFLHDFSPWLNIIVV